MRTLCRSQWTCAGYAHSSCPGMGMSPRSRGEERACPRSRDEEWACPPAPGLAEATVSEQRGSAHAACDADHRQGKLAWLTGSACLCQQPGHQHRTGGPVSVAESQGPAVEVRVLRVDPQLVEAGERLGRERLV